MTTTDERARLRQVARLLARVAGLVDPLRLRLWAECGITMSQLRLLLLMRQYPGVTSGALAERTRVHPSTITGHVEKLLQRGLVRREEDTQDRRVQHNYLTPQGGELAGQLERTAGHFLIGLLEQLSPAQVERLGDCLRDLLAAAETQRSLEIFDMAETNTAGAIAADARQATMQAVAAQSPE
ncbi:MAG TPA: MarR family transcriptional regulator [Dehalococcoidia bacterium]|nr:MarR family transcriptional regulator [Dehalococcoidia bacterium]